MFFTTQYITSILATLTAVGHIAFAAFLLLLLWQKVSGRKIGWLTKMLTWISSQAIPFAFIVSLSAVAGSLYYSELAGYEPCLYCWWQRIFIYPMALLFLLGLIKRDPKVNYYTLPFAVIAFAIAVYHYTTQIIGLYDKELANSLVVCSSTGGNSCTDFYFLQFGYITMPMMSVTATALIITLLLIHRKYKG